MGQDGRLETLGANAAALGTGSTAADVAIILEAHVAVVPSLRAAEASLADAIDLVVGALGAGGRLVYVGAGTSGWLAALDAAEVVVTFGMSGRVASVVGGGLTLDPVMMTLGDDAVTSLDDDAVVAGCGAGDVVVAVSASGRTPFTIAAVERMRRQGARVIAVVNEQGTPLTAGADAVVCVPTEGEVVAGSTRLSAGFAQKAVLNTLSTASMVRLGRTYDGQMVCVEPLNDKLRHRLAAAVARAVGVDEASARAALDDCGHGDVAVVALATGMGPVEASELLDRHGGNIRRAVVAHGGAF
jgi:N-acetylmuramic acid 6-phosphate etherase